jgi:4-cresol dehydrogenase (hydroxylating) flavoprotein subunit
MQFTGNPPDPQATDEALSEALELWRAALGSAAVLLDEEAAEFADPYSPQEFGFVPRVVLQPDCVEQVQEIVRIASRTGVPIWVNSQGRNNGYGGGAPRLPGTVVVNLRRMKRVLEINDELGYVVVEPGVSYRELYDAVRASGKSIIVDIPDLSWGSVVGNALDHGNGYTNYSDHAAALCGLEVVLPDGEIVRTGHGAMRDSPNWHVSKRGYGPQLDGLFTQSNFGIVTKAGIWMMPRPDSYAFGAIKVERDSDLEALVDTIRPFMVDGTIASCPTIFNSIGAVSNEATRAEVWPHPGPVPPEVTDQIGREFAGLGAWNLWFGIYGDRKVVTRHLERIAEAFSGLPDAEVESQFIEWDELSPDNDKLNQKQKVHGGVPDLSMLKVLEWEGGQRGGHISFSSTVPLTGADSRKIVELTRARLAQDNAEYFGGLVLYPRFAVHVSLLLYDLDIPGQVQRQYLAYADMVRQAAQLGYGEYRAHLRFMDLVAEQYAFNDSSLRRLAETIKDAIDPQGILAPGKQGIWPARLRGQAPHSREGG